MNKATPANAIIVASMLVTQAILLEPFELSRWLTSI
jgi:hypothetical protein